MEVSLMVDLDYHCHVHWTFVSSWRFLLLDSQTEHTNVYECLLLANVYAGDVRNKLNYRMVNLGEMTQILYEFGLTLSHVDILPREYS